jgi:hypothetical protein
MIVLTVGLSLFTRPLQAGVQLDIVARFQNSGLEFDVVTIIDSEAQTSRNK